MSQLDIFSLAGPRGHRDRRRWRRSDRPWPSALAGAGARVVVDRADARDLRRDRRADRGRRLRGPRRRRRRDQRGRLRSAGRGEVVERFGRVDILVNAVGGGAGKVLHPAEDYPRDDWDWIMELNVRSTVVPTQAVVRAMVAGGTAARS